jgi:general secretion pathway protein G
VALGRRTPGWRSFRGLFAAGFRILFRQRRLARGSATFPAPTASRQRAARKHRITVMCLLPKTFELSAPRPLVRRRHLRRAGFTLLEILVVLAIIGLLAGLAITNVDKIFGSAQTSTAKLFVNQTLKAGLNLYRIHTGNFPTTAEGLQALITAPSGKADKWHGPYIEGGKIPLDAWNEPYQYEYPGKRNKDSYDLWSKGPDKQSGTGDDIGNWDSGSGAEK